ncbi:class I SAM-dependent methyltransferase [Geminocystis herdmanii]|uniref:class I SAM-dependent methyltransferase n=1 Tax=Geminocystis herdmanii TaxID=669359 RepID=UPI0003491CA3|nr:class I SAM-dependent methyltransferase [Geminocystis herdmanii]
MNDKKITLENPLLNKIFQIINNSPEQKITFSQYMDLCLFDRTYGYYNSEKNIIGEEGDFYTSASLSSDLGELLAVQLYQFWEILDKPDNFKLVEMGAGNGNLSYNILNFIINNYPDFTTHIEYIIIEKSAILKEKQQKLLTAKFAHIIPITWTDLNSIPDNSITGCCFSNELIDAMPVHLIRFSDNKLEEIYLTEKDNTLVIKYDSISQEKILEYFDIIGIEFNSNFYPKNYQTEVNLEAIEWLKQISDKLKKGYLLSIDYGYTADKYYHPQRSEGTLKCYYQHRHHNNPYVNIGHQDITCHVNFTALEKYGELFGLNTLAYTKQALFLMGLGLGDRLNELSNGKMSLTTILHRRQELHNLINPEGLGNFGVLLQTKNISLTQNKYLLKGFQ